MRAMMVGAAVMLAAGASAETVTFEDGAGFFSNLEPDNFGLDATGTWNEAGFRVGFRAQNTFLLEDLSDLSAGDLVNLADDCSGCPDGPYSTGLTFSRSDGLTFGLDQVEVGGQRSSWLGFASFVPYAADGSLDYGNGVSEDFEVIFPDISLVGTRGDGSTVSASFESYGQAEFWNGNNSDGTGPITMNDGVLNQEELSVGSLSDLVSLSLGVGGSGSSEEAIRRSLSLADLDPIFDLAPADCQYVCDVEGLGQFEFVADAGSFYNFGVNIDFGDFTFTVADAPAPVPLPASGAMLAFGIVGLAAACRRRR